MQRLVFLASLILVTAVFPRMADASIIEVDCKIYARTSNDMPAAVKKSMKRRSEEFAEVCTHKDQVKISYYEAYGKIEKVGDDVCQFAVHDIDLESSGTEKRSSTRMFQTSADCPSYDDKRYVATEDVSSGLFVALKAFWDSLGSSRDILNRELAYVATKRDASTLEDVREAFNKRPSVSLGRIDLGPIELGLPQRAYKLESNDLSGVYMYVDMTPQGLRIIDVGRVMY